MPYPSATHVDHPAQSHVPSMMTAGGLHALQRDVLEAVASGLALDQIADLLCRIVERLVPETVCSVLTVDTNRVLHPLAGPSLPRAYSLALDGVAIGPEVGSCGTAAYLGLPVLSRDIDADPRWDGYKAMPLAAGLRACWSSPIKGRDGRVIATFAFYFRSCRDPTGYERQIVETSVHVCGLAIEHDEIWSRLELTNRRFDVALSNMSQGLCFFDGNRRLIVANRRYCEIYGLNPTSLEPGTSLEDIVALRVAAGSGPAMTPGEYLGWRDTVRDFTSASDTCVELANGRVIAIHHQPMPDSGWVATHEDITERRHAEAQVIYMARHDALTGLPNRRLFHERTDQALAAAGPARTCAALCLDLDGFKAVNDTFGHAVGDLLLQGVAERLQACIRAEDTVTRLGGDEFAVLMVGLDRPERAGELAQRIVSSLIEPFYLEGHRVVVGASIGIAFAPDDGSSPARLMKSADTALYRAKLDERGSYRFFEREMDARLQARLHLERDLREAVQAETFELVYQPLVDHASNRICAFEALLRWPHHTRGTLAPAEFIPLAEETGLIVPLGAWALRQACAQAATWAGDVKVSVNLSPVQLKSKALVGVVAGALSESGLPACRLELEIAESALLGNGAETLRTLHALRSLGVSVALDDFGTGFSSLSHLRSFPFDKIKLDQSFTRDLLAREDAVSIIRAIVSLGRSLGMATATEGIEAEAQLALLQSKERTEIQGFLLSHPRSGNDARLIVEHSLPWPPA